MMMLDYRCKFCRRPGVARFDGDDIADYQIKLWLEMLACNPCADYRMDRRRYIDGIRMSCDQLGAARIMFSGERLETKTRVINEALIHMTKKLSTIVCDHYRVTNVWDIEFVNMLVQSPDKWLPVVNKYIKGIAQMKREHSQAEALVGAS